MERALLSRFADDIRLMGRFTDLMRFKVRFAQQVLRTASKAYCFSDLTTISGTILRCGALQSAIWQRFAAFCIFFMESVPFTRFRKDLSPIGRFSNLRICKV